MPALNQPHPLHWWGLGLCCALRQVGWAPAEGRELGAHWVALATELWSAQTAGPTEDTGCPGCAGGEEKVSVGLGPHSARLLSSSSGRLILGWGWRRGQRVLPTPMEKVRPFIHHWKSAGFYSGQKLPEILVCAVGLRQACASEARGSLTGTSPGSGGPQPQLDTG